MKNRKTLIGIVLLIVVLLAGIAYAAITGTTLTINGSATASPDASNFTVKFTDTTSTAGDGTTTATKKDDLTAEFTVSGLDAKDQTASATFEIENGSADLSAALNVETTNSNETNFEVTSVVANPTVAAGGKTTVTVTVKLLTTPIDADLEATVTATLTATPVQPSAN